MRLSPPWIKDFAAHPLERYSCPAQTSQTKGLYQIIGHPWWFPISCTTNRVVPFFESSLPAGQRALARPAARSDKGLAVALALVQPAQQLSRLASRQLL